MYIQQSHDLVKSIQSFQTALRGDNTDSNSWTGLGEVYAESGRYVAASKAFARASAVDPENWYARFLLGMVHRQILEFDEAKDVFESVLRERPEEFVVLDHLCETFVASARHNVERRYFGDAISDAIEALKISGRISKINSRTFDLWKNTGDAIEIFLQVKSMVSKFPAEVVSELFQSVQIEADIYSEISNIDEADGVSINKLASVECSDILQTVIYFYILAFKISLLITFGTKRSKAVGWFNIACAELRAGIKFDRSFQYEQAAIECLKNAIKLEPKNAVFWNAYGIATAGRFPLISQHAFIRSLIIDHKQTVAWSNLGAMYLVKGDLELANLAFEKSQSADPDYVASWVGRGFIAAALGEEEEANGLFEHSFSICSGVDVITTFYFFVCLR